MKRHLQWQLYPCPFCLSIHISKVGASVLHHYLKRVGLYHKTPVIVLAHLTTHYYYTDSAGPLQCKFTCMVDKKPDLQLMR